MRKIGQLLVSFLIVAFGQPGWVGWLGPLAALGGYALFWDALLSLERSRFAIAAVWFCAVSAVQLSWMASTEYMGPLIVLVYAGLSLLWGLQFAWLSQGVRRSMSLLQVGALAGFWVWMEWVRIHILSGYSWNPVGLALAGTPQSLQFASLWGVYGLSFWVMATNLLVVARRMRWAIGFALVPYLFGAVWEPTMRSLAPVQKTIAALLVQTSLRPEEKDFYVPHSGTFVLPKQQWTRILNLIEEKKSGPLDLIVLPEAAVPFGAHEPLYTHDQVREVWRRLVGPHALIKLPAPVAPFAREEGGQWRVSNAYWAQCLANYYGVEVIAGLDDIEVGKKVNGAFLFRPGEHTAPRYEKRVLVPVGEYVPLRGWGPIARFIAREFQIESSFEAGSESKVFQGAHVYGISICYEETFAHLVRESVEKGAELLVNVTNDVWFPDSRLPRQHFEHARLRAVELGRSLVRSCNTGVTAVIDPFGRTVAELKSSAAGILEVNVPVQTVPTLYAFWGNGAILALSALAIAIARNRSVG